MESAPGPEVSSDDCAAASWLLEPIPVVASRGAMVATGPSAEVRPRGAGGRRGLDDADRGSLRSADSAMGDLERLRCDSSVGRDIKSRAALLEEGLRRHLSYLLAPDHRVAFIGAVGVGKSTAICKLAGLLAPGAGDLSKEVVLDTGQGGTTICPVVVVRGPRYGVRIEPRSAESICKDVDDYADYLIGRPRGATGPAEESGRSALSTEVTRAIRNLAGLVRSKPKGESAAADPARELAARHDNARELAEEIVRRMDLDARDRHELWHGEGDAIDPMIWLKKTFAKVNGGRLPDVTIPERIEVSIPWPVLREVRFDVELLDTRGVSEEYALRRDLMSHFDDPRTLVVLCSKFAQAPDATIKSLLRGASDVDSPGLLDKTVILVLPQDGEAERVKEDDGSEVETYREGCERKREAIELALDRMGLRPVEVCFFNAKGDPPEEIRRRLVAKIDTLRQVSRDQIAKHAEEVEHLLMEREDEVERLVFQEVNARLARWVEDHHEVESTDPTVRAGLLGEIAQCHSATIHAAVRRRGEWHALDYYLHLGWRSRVAAVERIGRRVEALKSMIDGLIVDDRLSPAHPYLEDLKQSISHRANNAYMDIEAAGASLYKAGLQADHPLWWRAENRWGGGKGYKEDVRELTAEGLLRCEAGKARVGSLIKKEWEGIISHLNKTILQRPD